MRGLRRLVEQLPVSQVRREALRRILPLVEIIVGLLYVLISVPVILDNDPTTTPIVTAAILLGGVAVLWFAIRDFAHGVLLKASDVCRVGDIIQFGDVAALRGVLKQLVELVLGPEVTGHDAEGEPFHEVERLSVEAAWRAATVDAAEAAGLPVAMQPGGPADFVIWNGDPLANLDEASVHSTWVDGQCVFGEHLCGLRS